ncbi:hypothetical protein [Rhizobium sp. EC-SD404]|nr:hypothetical protein [Rhizobium sp. EC-SD404]VVT34343.1 hypothetical protein RHIZ404_90018 [Rhizobium sp. EC-SD404]
MAQIRTPENQRNFMGGILILGAVVFGYFWYATAPMDAIAPIQGETQTQ